MRSHSNYSENQSLFLCTFIQVTGHFYVKNDGEIFTKAGWSGCCEVITFLRLVIKLSGASAMAWVCTVVNEMAY